MKKLWLLLCYGQRILPILALLAGASGSVRAAISDSGAVVANVGAIGGTTLSVTPLAAVVPGRLMVAFSNTRQLTSAQDIEGTRAYREPCAAFSAGTPQILPGGTSTFDGGFGFGVGVSCSAQTCTEGSAMPNVNIYTINLVAETGSVGSIGFVERSMTATVER